MSDAIQALYRGESEQGEALLPPEGDLSVFEAAAFGHVERLRAILEAERRRRERQIGLAAFVNRLRGER